MNYGEKIARLRKSRGMTQEELGKVLNVTYQAVSKWERGESLPDFPTMSQIAKFFEVPLDYFEDGGETRQAQDAASDAVSPVNSAAGVCTVCGKMLKEDEIFESSPKIICKTCAERQKRDAELKKKAEEERIKREKDRYVQMELGSGCDFKLIVSIIVALACAGVLTFLSFMYKDSDFYDLLLLLAPIAAFACTHAVFDLINELRDKDDDFEGYTLKLSLIVAGAFSVLHIILFLVLYFVIGKNSIFLLLVGLGAVVPFTFVSQIMWGSVIKSIFTCGGFTFKLPGFIFSLDIDSIIWMIVTKLFLGIISVLIFIVTTILFAVIAMLGSVITFIPCILVKVAKDKKALAD